MGDLIAHPHTEPLPPARPHLPQQSHTSLVVLLPMGAIFFQTTTFMHQPWWGAVHRNTGNFQVTMPLKAMYPLPQQTSAFSKGGLERSFTIHDWVLLGLVFYMTYEGNHHCCELSAQWLCLAPKIEFHNIPPFPVTLTLFLPPLPWCSLSLGGGSIDVW